MAWLRQAPLLTTINAILCKLQVACIKEHCLAKKKFGSAPFTVLSLDKSGLISSADIQRILDSNDGAATICVREDAGAEKRGGYFFHLKYHTEEGRVEIFTFERHPVVKLTLSDTVRFINHAAGRKFDEELLSLCQNEINFRADEVQPETDT
jgi:hypothetical protein